MNAIQYVRNAGRSLGYATIDVLKSYNPVFVESASQVKSLTEEVYQSIKDFKSNLTPSGDENSFVGQAKDALKDIWKSTKEDITSGNWYNKQRINANQEAAFNELMGGGDFDFNFDDDFGDFDFEDEDLEESVKEEVASDRQTAREIVGGVDAIAAKSVGAIATATVQSAEHIASIQERSAKALYNLNERGFATLSKGIGAISASMNVMQSLAEPLTAHMQNSATFYTKSTEFQNKTLELLTKIEQGINPKEERRSFSRKLTPDDLVTNGTLDLKNYFDFIKGNVKEYTDMVTSLLDMVGGVKGAGKMAAGSPLSGLLTMAVEKIMPKVLKDNMKEFNEMFEGAVYTFLGSLKDRDFGNSILGDIFKELFAPDFKFKDQFNVNRFQKGPMKWDGTARYALTQVIPLQLSKLISIIGKEDRTMIDYRTGRWRKLKNARGEIRQKIKYNATSNDLNWETKRVIDAQKSRGVISETQADKLNKSIDDLMMEMMVSNDDKSINIVLNPDSSKQDLQKVAKKFKTDTETINILRFVIMANERKGKRSIKTNFTGSIVRGRVNSNRLMNDLSEEGGLEAALYNGAYTEEDEKKEKNNTSGSKGLLSLSHDKYGNDIFYYLQGIYRASMHISANIPYLIGGGGGGKKGKKSKGNYKSFDNINIDNNATDETAGANKANAGNAPAGNIFNGIDDAFRSISRNLDYSFSTKEVENYYSKKIEFLKQPGNNEEKWKASAFYDENLETRMDKDIRSSKLIGRLKDRFADSRLNPLITSISGLFDKVGSLLMKPATKIADLYSSLGTSINNALYGEGQEGGIKDWIRDLIHDFRGTMTKLGKFFAEKLGVKLFGEKDSTGRYDNNKFFGRMLNQTKDTLKEAANRVKTHLGFARGGVVTRTGVTTVSKGEIIIPSGRGVIPDENDERWAYIRKITAKGKPFEELSEEEQLKVLKQATRMKWASGLKGNIWKRGLSGKTLNEMHSEYGDDVISGDARSFAKMSLNKIGEAVSTVLSRIFGSEKEIDDTKKKFNEKSKKIMEALEEGGGGGLGAGAILGAGTSILTGGLINPLLGAGLGAVVGFVKKSKTAQNLLFGEEEDPDKFRTKLKHFILDQVPGIAEGAGIGGTAGIFLGSPVLGSILGGTIGFISSSDKAKDFLFGKVGEDGKRKNGLISKELQDKIKSSLPNIGAGAIAGLIGGPFGLAGNLLLGSVLGFASSTDGFKNWMFGEEVTDENGNKSRKGGLLGTLRENIADPIVGIFQKLGEEMKHDFRNLAKGLKSSISKIFEKTVGKIKETTIGKKVLGFGNKVLNGALGLISAPLKGFNNLLEARHLRKGYGIKGKNGEYLDAFARQELGKNHSRYAGSIGAKYDEFLAGASADQIDLLLNNINGIKENGDFADLRNDRTRVLKRLKRSLMSASSLTAEQQNEVLQAAESGGVDAAKAVLRKYGIDENRFSDDFNSLGKANKNLTNAKSGYDALKQLTGGNINIDDFKDLLTQEKEARSKLNEDQVKEREERKNHIITDVIPNRIDTMIKVLASIANSEPIDPNSELGQDIRKYGSDVNSIFKDAKQREYDASNERAEDALNEFLDGDERAVNGAMNLRKGRQGISLKIQMAFRSLSNKLKEGIGGMFSTLFGTAKAGLKAVGAIGRLAGTLFKSGKRVVKGFFEKGKHAVGGAKNFFKLFAGPGTSSNTDTTETAGEGSGLWDIGFADGGIVAEDGVFPLSEGEVVLPTTRNKKKEKLTELGSILTGRLGKMFKGIPIVGTINLDGVFAKRVPSLKNTLKANFGNAAGEDNTDAGAVNVAEEGDKREEGGIQQIFHNGGWVSEEDYKTDQEYKKAMIGLPAGLGGLGKLFGFGKEDKEEEEKKKGFFQTIIEGLFGKNGEPGFLNGLFSFLTGSNVVKTVGIGAFLRSAAKGIAGTTLKLLPGAIGIAALTGALDGVAKKIGDVVAKLYDDNNPEGTHNGITTEQMTLANGEEIATDENGNEVRDENGNLVTVDGKSITGNPNIKVYGEDNRLSTRVGRNILTTGLRAIAKGSLTQGLKNGASLPMALSTSFMYNPAGAMVNKSTQALTGHRLPGFIGKCVTKIKEFFTNVGQALIKKFPKAGKVCENLSVKFGEYFSKEVTEDAARIAAEGLEKAAKALYIVQLVGAAINAIGDAPSYLQVTTPFQELPLGATLIAVIINVVNNAIPFIGGLIPTKLFFNLFYGAVKAAGLDDPWFKDWEKKRAEATAEVEAFNKETGNNFNIEEYNHYMHNNGLVTDIGNSYAGAIKTLQNEKNRYEFGDITKGIGYDVQQKIEGKAKELGLENGINNISDFGKALSIGGSIAGDFGYDLLTENLISSTINDRLNSWSDRGLIKGYDKFMTGVGNAIVGAETGLENAGNWVKDKASNAWDGIKNFGSSIGQGFQNAGNWVKDKASNAWGGIKNFGSSIGQGASDVYNNIKSGISNIGESISNSGPVKYAREAVSQLGKTNDLFIEAMKEGDLNKLLAAKESIKAGSENGDFTQFQASMSDVQYLLLWTPTALKSLGNKIKTKFDEIKSKVSGVVTKIKNVNQDLFTPAFKGDVAAVENYEIPSDPQNPVGQLVAGVSNVAKLVAKPVAYISRVFNSVKEKFDSVKQAGSKSIENLKTGVSELSAKAFSGDTEGVENYQYPVDENSAISKIVGVAMDLLKTHIATPVVAVTGTFLTIKSKIQEGIEKGKNATAALKETIPDMWELAKAGEITKLDSYDYSKATDAPIIGNIYGTGLGIAKGALTGISVFTHIGAVIKEKVSSIVDNIKKGKEKYDQNMDSIADYALKGDLHAIWNGEHGGGGARVGETSSSSPLDWIWNIATFISRIFYSVIGVVNGIGVKIKDGFNNVKEGVKSFFSNIGNFFDDWLGVDYTEGKGSGIAGKGSNNFVSQFDYSGMKMGTGESVADAGCGPAVAAMAARDAGVPLSMGTAVRASDNYQTTGGTDISYFGNTMGKMGIPTRTMTNKNEIYSSLGGRGAILLGQDNTNTSKKNSPFGPGAHYVYSPGTDRRGNIIVNDPEGRAPRTYSPRILNKTIAAVGVGRGARIPKYYGGRSTRFSGKSTNTTVSQDQIFAWLIKEMGFSDFQAAAVMGCWQAESGNRFRRIEGDPKDFDGIAYNRSSLTNYAYTLFDIYARQGLSIDRDAYKANDGLHYVGLGLCQWTGPRAKRLFDLAESMNRPWIDPEVQLGLFRDEMNSSYKGTYDRTLSTKNIEDATEVFGVGFEHGGLIKGTDGYNIRLSYAKAIFQKYANRPLADVSDMSVGGGIDPRQKLIDIARGELGYHEGENNYNKYSNSNVAWCGSFVRWLYEQVSDNDPETYQKLTGVNINTQREWITPILPQEMRRYYKDGEVPQPGDIVAYSKEGGSGVDHTGIVAIVDPSTESFIGIDGNWGDAVSETHRPYNGKVSMGQKVAWWARPNWQAAFPNGYFGSGYGNSYSSGSSNGAGKEGSGNVLSDYLSGISSVVSEVFSRIFGKQKEEHEESGDYSSGDYSSSYGDYGSYYGDYGSYGDVQSAAKHRDGDQADTWEWNRKTAQLTPRSPDEASEWALAKTAYDKAKLIAKWNGRYLPPDVKMSPQEEDSIRRNGGTDSYIDWYMKHSIPLHRSTGVYVIPNNYKRFNWKKGDAAKITPSSIGVSINSPSDIKNWELTKKDPGRLFRLIAKYYGREYPNLVFPSGAAFEEFAKSPNAAFDWVDSALMNYTIPGSDLRSKWLDLNNSSPSDVKEYRSSLPNYKEAIGPVPTGGYTNQNANALNDLNNAMELYNLSQHNNNSISSYNYNLKEAAGLGSGLVDSRDKEKITQYNIKHLSGWGTQTQGRSGTNRPSRSVYTGKGSADSYNIAPVSAPTSRIAPETAVLLKAIVTLIESLVKNTSQVDGIFELVKTIAEQNGVSDAAMIAALNNLKTDNSGIEPGLAELKKTVDSMLLA